MPITQTVNGPEKHAAQKAIFDGIVAAAKDLGDETYASSYQAEVLKDLAFAFRLAAGGPQPGSVEIEPSK